MRNILVIENPKAGRHKARGQVQQLLRDLQEAGIKTTYDVSLYKGYLQEKYTEGVSFPYTDVVACGGDGTLHDVINVFADHKVGIAVYPVGSANDFFLANNRTFIPEELNQRIIQGEYQYIDLCRINDHYFFNNAGIGLDAKTLEIMESARKYFFGKFAYKTSALVAISTYQAAKGTFIVDGVSYEREFMIATACNAPYFGGGMMISPDSKADDGMIELVLLNKTNKIHLLQLFKKIFRGDHLGDDKVEVFRGKRIQIQTDASMTYHCEGELVGKTPIDIEVLPKALKMIL